VVDELFYSYAVILHSSYSAQGPEKNTPCVTVNVQEV